MKEFSPPIRSRSTDELILIVQGEGWDADAIEQAQEELNKRNISDDTQWNRWRELHPKYGSDQQVIFERGEPIVTVSTFSFPHQLLLIRSVLESEGIHCFTKDELTIQIMPLYSLAIGGIKLQAFESDAIRARAVLQEEGYERDPVDANSLVQKIVSTLQQIPIVKEFHFSVHNLLIAGAALFALFMLISILTKPGDADLLMNHIWCVQKMVYRDSVLSPGSLGLKVVYSNGCDEQITFRDNASVTLPGFNTFPVTGHWSAGHSKVMIQIPDTLNKIYEDTFIINMNRGDLQLYGNHLVIYCSEM
ncbi:MAG TPA: DUF2007 domain-containing protein [Chitinophagales bacterium]|nr:DUF2007 domain-containing protein [Chitinophagales bacterium]